MEENGLVIVNHVLGAWVFLGASLISQSPATTIDFAQNSYVNSAWSFSVIFIWPDSVWGVRRGVIRVVERPPRVASVGPGVDGPGHHPGQRWRHKVERVLAHVDGDVLGLENALETEAIGWTSGFLIFLDAIFISYGRNTAKYVLCFHT